jgi:hypothetical protein
MTCGSEAIERLGQQGEPKISDLDDGVSVDGAREQ